MSDVMTRLAELPPEQRRLLELRLKEAQARKARALGPRARTGQAIPLSFSQQRLWFLERLDPGTGAYNLPAPIRLQGPVDAAALERTLNAVRARHEALRTTFAERDGEPVQVIHSFAPIPLPVDDLSALDEAAREAEARRITGEEAHAGFDLERGPLFRARLVRLAGEEHLLLLTLHHAIGDAWSLGVLTREMEALYDAFTQGRPDPLAPPALQFADFAAWQHEHLDAATEARHLAFWRRVLEGAAPVLELPEYHPIPLGPRGRGEALERRVPRALAERVRAVAAAENATPFAVLLAAFRLSLARHAGHGGVVLGTAAAGRERKEVEGLIGFVANTLALRTDLGGDPEFRALVRRERDTLLDAFEHQALPFERVVEALKLAPDPGRNPVFQAMLTYQGVADFQGMGADALRLGEARGRWEAVDFHPAKFDLTAAVIQDVDELWVQLEWAADLLDRPSAERIATHFLRLLEQGAEDPGRRLSELDPMDAEERSLVLGPWTRGAALPATDGAAHRLFEARAAEQPDAPAVEGDGVTLSYAELDARANALARRLRAAGVGLETPVGVALERSPALITALLGVLKAGGVYVPLDPTLPGERQAWIAEDAGITALVTRGAIAPELAALGLPVVSVDGGSVDGDGEASASPDSLAADVPAEAAAYVIYTSGSTGRPKGVVIPHGELARHCLAAARAFGLGPDDRLLQFMAPGFDVSLEQMLAPLSAGACVLPGGGEIPSTAEVAALVRDRGITVVNPPTAYWHTLADDAPARDAVKAAARVVMAGGEAMRADAARAWAAAPGRARLLNVYGPTETVVSCTAFEVGAGFTAERVPLGMPLPGRRAYVLDAALRPCGVGIPGELCVGGVLARGYLGRPGATAAAFVPDPFGDEPGARLYRTGDRVRWREDGTLDFLGRGDQQVKVRGFRVEPGEVEAALRALPGVADAVVLPRPGAGGVDRLVAWVVPAGGAPDEEELFTGLRRTLPHYLVPATVVWIDHVPLTANGKVDRRALPEPTAEACEEAFIAPRTATEAALARLWSSLLGMERVGVSDDFFAQGGHSLLAVRLVSRIRDELGVELPLRVMFESPTLAALAARVDAADDGKPAAAPIPRADRSAPLPLSFAQERLWFLAELDPGSSHYNVPMALELAGPLDAAALSRALHEIVRRHESLRTAFVPDADGPLQRILPPDAFHVASVDLSAAPDPRIEAERWMAEEGVRPFDLETGPLLRAALLRLAPESHVLLTVFHHATSDAWSAGVFLRELGALYAAYRRGRPSPLAEPPLQYADFAAWQRAWLQGEELERQLAFWRERLKGAPATLGLPTDRPRPASQDLAGAAHHFELSAEAAAAVRALAAGVGEGATPFMALVAAFAAVLHRWSGEDDLVIGTPIASRSRGELEELIGFFGNTLPLRADLSGDPSLRALVAQARETTVDAFAHQDVPFEKLVDALGVERSLSHSPLFQVMLTLQNAAEGEVALDGLEVTLGAPDLATSRFDLTVGLWETGAGFSGMAEYATSLWDEATIARLTAHLDALLRAAGAAPDAPISTLPLLSRAERAQVVADFNQTHRPELLAGDVVGMSAMQAALNPDAPALEHPGGVLSYAEVDAWANRIAHRLARMGVGPDARVAVCLERSPELPVAVLAVLRAGAGYVAVDPAYPAARVAYMLENSRSHVVLTTSDVAERIPAVEGTAVVLLDAEAEEIAREPSHALVVTVDPDNLGYVLYTSGSTGTPKGAMLPRRALDALVRWHIDRWGDGAKARTLQFASLSFDPSYLEIVATWAAGGTLVLIDDDTRRDAERLLAHLRENRIERIFIPFAGLQNLAETADVLGDRGQGTGDSQQDEVARLPWLRDVITAGEALRATPQLRAFFRANPKARLDNHYGPSETHVVSAHKLDADPDAWVPLPPIGPPIANTQLYVLDGRMEPTPVGVPGELYAGGECLGRGYLERPGTTADKFVPDPFSGVPGARMYRTGDRAKWRLDGEVDFLGRNDDQVKVRGFRVEPGEVEAVLGTHPAVREAAAAAHGEGSEKRLVGYVVPVAGASPSVAEFRAHVAARLPEYMVPAAFVTLDQLPLTPSGKVDRRALPEPDPSASYVGKVPPRTPAEEVVAAVWERVLGVFPGVHDDFFSLGGHSLRATQVVARIREAFGIDMPLRALFESPTVAGLAARAMLARAGGEEHRAAPLVAVEHDGPIPLSFAQQRFWFVERLGAAPAAYNVPLVLRMRGVLSADALRRALNGVVARHEALRTVYPTEAGGAVQRVLPSLSIPLPLDDLSHLPAPVRDARAKAKSDAEARVEFDLQTGPLLRARLLRLAADEHLFLLTLHHIAVDAWSVTILFRELAALYAAELDGRDPGLQPLAVQYADYAVWQRERLQGAAMEAELAYWRDRLEGTATLALPTDRPHPAVQSFRGATHGFALPRESWEAATALARRSGATPFMVLLAAFDALLHRWSGTEDVVVGSPVAGRTPEQTEPLIGVFLNTLALRADLSGDPTFAGLLGRVRDATLDAYAHQEVPFERLVEELKIERSLTRHPLFQVIFSMHAESTSAPELPGLVVEVGEGDTGTTKVDLVLAAAEHRGEMHCVFQYASDLWDAETIERMATHLQVLLAAATADPQLRLSQLPMMPEEEEALVVETWNRTAADHPRGIAIHHLFEAAADANPDAIAVSHVGGSLTYRALEERANRLAHRLVRLGIGPEVRVAVCMERTPELIVALMAVLKAGGGYVPIDPAYPAERIAWMLEDCEAPVLLTDRGQGIGDRGQPARAGLPSFAGTTIRVDADWAEIAAAESSERPDVEVRPENVAYAIYTSGSTGRPKGVQIEHRSTVALLHWLKEHVSDEERSAVLGSTSVSFDVSIAEIFGTLCWGGRLILVRNALAVAEIPAGEAPVLASMAPSAAAELLRTGAIPPSVRVLNLGGEALPNALAQGLYDTGSVERVVNLYGPTEDTTYSTYSIVEPGGDRVWIGQPVSNTRAYVVDGAFRPVPVGVWGELYLAGEGLSRGYHRRPALTAERFVPNPFDAPGSRMYRVGDRVRWRADGNLEYMGRLDHQVKIRGHRVETGEIEAVLADHPSLQEAAVVARADASGDVRLIAYVVASAGHEAPAAGELRTFLKARLPDYMVPAGFVAMDRLPLSPNGKVDRLSLSESVPAEAPREARAEPKSVPERAIAKVWEEVLELPGGVGMDDNFFEIGGHSLLVGRMQERLQAELGVEVKVVALFLYPTVRALAEHLAAASSDEARPDETAGKSADRGSGRREMMGRLRRR